MIEGNRDLEYYRETVRDNADIRIGRYSFKENAIFMDDINQSFISRLFQLQSYEWFIMPAHLLNMYVEEEYDNRTTSNKTGRALAGGLMFGTVGAVVGAASGKQTQVNRLTKLKIKFKEKEDENDLTCTINLLREFGEVAVDVQTMKYEEIMDYAHSIVDWYNRYSWPNLVDLVRGAAFLLQILFNLPIYSSLHNIHYKK